MEIQYSGVNTSFLMGRLALRDMQLHVALVPIDSARFGRTERVTGSCRGDATDGDSENGDPPAYREPNATTS